MRRARAGGMGIALLSAALAGWTPLLGDSAAASNNEGNRLYNQEQYDEALKMYTDAQAKRPEAPELHYNIGNVLYRKGDFEKAAGEYLRAQSAEDPGLSQAATYNRGNALMMQKRLQEAVNAYIQALRASPSDEDAKRNLELALRLLEEQQQQRQQEQNEDQSREQQQEPEDRPQPPDQSQQDQQQPRPRRAGEMSPEEARQILDALREEEKEGIRKHARATVPDKPDPEKDW